MKLGRVFLLLAAVIGCGGGGTEERDCTAGAIACPVGFQCSFKTLHCEDASATMHWTLTDGCADGAGIQGRLFDVTNGGLWPDANTVWRVDLEGGYIDESIACIPGAKICYGVEPSPADGHYWGIAADGSQNCTSCCATCGALDQQTQITLTCN